MKLSRKSHWYVAGCVTVIAALLILARPFGPSPTADRPFDEPGSAGEFEYRRRAPTAPGVDTIALYDRADARVARMARFASRLNRSLPDAQPSARVWLAGDRVRSLSGSSLSILDAWTPLGPGNIGGRTRVVRFHPTRPETVFAAGVSGGIWRIDDLATGSWRPIGDVGNTMLNIAVNALAIDPRNPDVMFAGTGEGYMREEIRGTGLPLRGAGIFMTRDGGNAWQRLVSTATSDFYWVNDLELGIGDSRRLYAATRTGVWRSIDAGESWTRLLGTNVRGGCLELAIRPDREEDVLFASCGSYEQAAVYRFPRASVSEHADVVLREPGMGRTSLAIAPSNPDVMYAMAASNDPGPEGNYRQALLAVFRSDRGGDPGSWVTRVDNADPVRLNTLLLTNVSGATVRDCSTNPNAQNSITNMGWYVNVLAVDPRDPNRVWAAGVDWFRSDDGGRSWGLATSGGSAQPSYSHVDQHGIAFHPQYDGERNQVALIGNDGGVFRTANARGPTASGPRAGCSPSTVGVNWLGLNRNYGVTQFYHGLPYDEGRRYLAGAQDNGTVMGFDGDGPDAWRPILGGDGSYVAVTATGSTMYAQSQWANIARGANGASFVSVRNGLDAPRTDVLGPDANYLFITPLAMDPSASQRLWIGGEHLYRTNNSASVWTKASTPMHDGGLVSAIAIAPTDSNRVMAGTNRGHLMFSSAALQATSSTAWQTARPREGWVTSVAYDSRNADVVYATYGSFGGPHIFRSADGGVTWTAIDGAGEGALPDIPVHSLVVDPDEGSRLYLGTDAGVFVSIDGGRRWMVEETGFGPAVTEWLALTRDAAGGKLLFAFTHGRGAWRVSLR